MRVVILAAGMGRRFRRLDLPKPLTCLATGDSILSLQIQTLSKMVSPHKITVVVGYRKEKIIENFPDLSYVYSPKYAEQNTAKSLLRATEKVFDEDLLWLNGDVVFHPDVLKALLNGKYQNKMIVNVGPVGDEEVKYRVNNRGKILEISKEIACDVAKGEALGINFFKAKDLHALKRNLERCKESDYFEKAIEMCIEEGISVWGVPVEHSHCTEIDFPEDLDRANQMIRGEIWKRQSRSLM